MNKNQDENRCLVFNNFAEEHGKIWFWATNYNALFQGSIDGGIALGLWGENDKEAAGSLYSKVVKYGHKIVGIPMCTDNILVYDINTEEARFISIPEQDWGNMKALERGRFWDGVVWENYIYMIGYYSAKVLKFDVVNESIVDVIDLYEGLDIPLKEKRRLSFKNALVVDNKILIPGYVINCIFVLRPNNMQYEKIVVEKIGNGFSDITYDGEDIWLSPRERGQLVKWNMQKNEISLHDNYPAEFHMEDQANISGMEFCNGKVYVFPYKADKAFTIKKAGNDIEMYTEGAFNHYYEDLCTHNEVMKYLFVQSIGNQLYSFCTESRRVLSYNTENGLLSELKFVISDEDHLHFDMSNCGIVYEDHGSLSQFIKILADNVQWNHVNKESIQHNIGEEIYNRVKRD